jgi:hypothetical protein
MTVISYPIPPYQNLPIESQYYQPSQFVISAVTLGASTTITTTVNTNYTIGQEVRLLIPPTFGCRQLNNQTGFVESIPNPNQVTLDIDSSMNVDPYIASNATTQAQIVAIGDVNTGAQNASGNMSTSITVPGAFINISPE